MMKRGVFFTMDSVFGLMILATIFGVFALLSIETVSAEVMHEDLHVHAEDTIDVMSKLRLWDIRHEPVVKEVIATNAVGPEDINKTVLDVVGALWAENTTQANVAVARKLVASIFSGTVPPNLDWAIQINTGETIETAYNTSEMRSGRPMSAVSRRLLSGYMKGNRTYGFTTRAFLSNTFRNDVDYVFFGGFVGQGNITVYSRNIPADATVNEIYMEMALGGNFTLYVGGTSCGHFERQAGPYAVSNWSITDPACLSQVLRGTPTRLDFVFDPPLTDDYIGGGYIHIKYASSSFSSPSMTTRFYNFPGIQGFVNLYDSFFVPGSITSISGRLHLRSDYDMLLYIGNRTPVNLTGSPLTQTLSLTDDNFSSLIYSEISSKTVPIRLGTPAATLQVDSSPGDIMLVTDVSGSMQWCSDQTEGCCDIPTKGTCLLGDNCSCGSPGESCSQTNSSFTEEGVDYCGYRIFANCVSPNQNRINITINASNEFLRIVLNSTNNRVGIVEYSGLGRARGLQSDLWIPAPTFQIPGINITPGSGIPGRMRNYTITVNIQNIGGTNSGPFNLTLYNASVIDQCTIDANNTPANTIGTVEVPGLDASQWASVSINWTANLSKNTYITAYADPENSISETDECNQKKNASIKISKPNIKLSNITSYKVTRHGYNFTASSMGTLCQNASNTTITIRAVETRGIEVRDVDMNLSIDTTFPNGTRLYVPLDFRRINISASGTVVYNIVLGADFMEGIVGAYDMWDNDTALRFRGTADYLNLIEESIETDNTAEHTLFPHRPNIRVNTFTMVPDGLCAGVHSIQFTSRAWIGTCPVVDPFDLTIYQEGVQIITNAVYINESQGIFLGYYDSTPLFADTITDDFTENTTFTLWVDNPPAPNGLVAESDEADNTATLMLEVMEYPDLVVPGMNVFSGNHMNVWSPSRAAEGDNYHGICFGENVPLDFMVTVTNRGCPTTDDFNVTLSSTPYGGSAPVTLLGTHTLHGLAQGATSYEHFNIVLNTMEDLRMIGWADPENVIVEENEDNNNATYIFQEQVSNLNITRMHVVPDIGAPPYYDPPEYLEIGSFCRVLGVGVNYTVDMNITNDGPCNIYQPFNSSFGFSTTFGTNSLNLYQQTFNGLNRGQVANLHYVWDGINPFLGVHVSEQPEYGFHINGFVDFIPNSTGSIILSGLHRPPAGQGYIWENHEAYGGPTDNYFWSYFENSWVRTAVTNISAAKVSDELVQINATVRNRNANCPAPRDFDVNFFAPNFNGIGDRINKTNTPALQPGESANVSAYWYTTLAFDTLYNIYAWSNPGYAGGATGPEDAFYDEDSWQCHYSIPPPSDCLAINQTTIFISGAGHGAPFIEHLKQVLLAPPQKKPMLRISEFLVSPSRAACGSLSKFRLTATLENYGEGASDGGTVEFYAESEKIGAVDIPIIEPGKSAQVAMKWETLLSSDITFTAAAGSSSKSFLVKDPPCPNSPDTTLFPDGIVDAHDFTNDLTELSAFVNDSETWYETCICCGIIRATNMFIAQSPPGRIRSMAVMSDGRANRGCAGMGPGMTGDAIEDTVQAACNAYNNHGIIIYTVGFGADVDADTLNRTALCANGTYFDARDTSMLMDAYRAIAAQLLNLSYRYQVIETRGANQTILYPDSYLQFTYTPKSEPLEYRDLITTVETDAFPSCSGQFQVPAALTPLNVKVTSYSGNLWTSGVTIDNGTGNWPVFNLSYFGNSFSSLGDPYVIEFDPTDPLGPGAQYPGITSNAPAVITVNVSTGERPGVISATCPNRNRAIYEALIRGSVPFSSVLPEITGRNVRVYYDLDGDGVTDGNVTLPVGKDLKDVPFDPTIVEMPFIEHESETNAVASTLLELMGQLNFITDNSCSGSPEAPGSQCNPIDVKITEDIIMRSVAINEVPYMYGPVDVGVVTWIK